MIIDWGYDNAKGVSANSLQSLIDITQRPDFKCAELASQNVQSAMSTLSGQNPPLDSAALPIPIPSPADYFLTSEGWTNSTIEIPLPHSSSTVTEDKAPRVKVGNIFHRSILGGIISAFQSKSFYKLNLKGFKQLWKPSDSEPVERVLGEAYMSDTFHELEEDVRKSLLADGNPDNLETVVTPILWYSDSANMAQFGTASLWSTFQFVGSISKYVHAKMSAFTAYHLAYLPSVCFLL